MSQSNAYGHEIEYDHDKDVWIYSDTKESLIHISPCKHCGKLPTNEGYDGCIGELPNVKFACCGHGKDKPYAILNDSNKRIDFNNINEMKMFF
jgi:hypothetical protein